MFAAAHHSTADIQSFVGYLVVLGCLGVAAFCAYKSQALAAILLLVVALVAAYILLL
jgi:hypothetical protein